MYFDHKIVKIFIQQLCLGYSQGELLFQNLYNTLLKLDIYFQFHIFLKANTVQFKTTTDRFDWIVLSEPFMTCLYIFRVK